MRKLAGKLAPHMLFWAAMIAVTVMAWVLYDSEMEARASAESVAKTYETLEVIHGIEEHLTQAESAQREYLVTSTDRYTVARNQAM